MESSGIEPVTSGLQSARVSQPLLASDRPRGVNREIGALGEPLRSRRHRRFRHLSSRRGGFERSGDPVLVGGGNEQVRVDLERDARFACPSWCATDVTGRPFVIRTLAHVCRLPALEHRPSRVRLRPGGSNPLAARAGSRKPGGKGRREPNGRAPRLCSGIRGETACQPSGRSPTSSRARRSRSSCSCRSGTRPGDLIQIGLFVWARMSSIPGDDAGSPRREHRKPYEREEAAMGRRRIGRRSQSSP